MHLGLSAAGFVERESRDACLLSKKYERKNQKRYKHMPQPNKRDSRERGTLGLKNTNQRSRGLVSMSFNWDNIKWEVRESMDGQGVWVMVRWSTFDSFIMDPNKWIAIQRCWWTLPCLCHCDACPVQSPSLFFGLCLILSQ